MKDLEKLKRRKSSSVASM